MLAEKIKNGQPNKGTCTYDTGIFADYSCLCAHIKVFLKIARQLVSRSYWGWQSHSAHSETNELLPVASSGGL